MSEKFKCYNSIQYVKKHKSSSNLKLPTTFFFLFFFCAFYYVSNALHHFLLRYFRDFFTIIWRSFFFLGRVSLKTCFDGFPYFHKKSFFFSPPKKNSERLVGNRRLGLPTKKDMGIFLARHGYYVVCDYNTIF